MAGIQASAETLLRQSRSGNAEEQRLLTEMLQETSRVGRLVNDLLRAARLDQGMQLEPAPCDVAAVCRHEVERVQRVEPSLTVTTDAPGWNGQRPALDGRAVHEIVGNLLDNARRHARSRVEVSVIRSTGSIEVRVGDDGPGLPDDATTRVFERFVKPPSNASGDRWPPAPAEGHHGQRSPPAIIGDPAMVRSVTLRPWQKTALERLSATVEPDFLAVATPGAGKTTFALTAARQALATDAGRRLVVVVPTVHLKEQWARAASAFDLHLDPHWSATDGGLPADMHGVAVTYQQVAGCGAVLRGLSGNAMVVFDELHHAAEERVWGDALRIAFAAAPRRLALSGTPFRSDTHAIPFVRYTLDEAVPDFEYGYADALADGGVVRPVYFPRVDGHMEWSAPDGRVHAHSFDDPLDAARAGQRLRTAYSVEGEWLPHVLRQAHERLLAIRQRQPDAGGLVIATDQEHARGIVRLLRDRLKVRAVVATSDDPDASALISRFGAGTDPWIVAVRMVAEGVDIPRLRVGVFATTTTTELFFRQAVGRLVRWTRGSSGQKSFLYIPDEPRLRARAFAIAEQRRHSLRRSEREQPTEQAEAGGGEDDQLSLFAPISAVPVTDGTEPDWVLDGDDLSDPTADAALTIALPPLPPGRRGLTAGAAEGGTRREHKTRLRKANADAGRLIAHHTGLTHAGVNAELNRASGLDKISQATVEQLERRLVRAEQWLRQASSRRISG